MLDPLVSLLKLTTNALDGGRTGDADGETGRGAEAREEREEAGQAHEEADPKATASHRETTARAAEPHLRLAIRADPRNWDAYRELARLTRFLAADEGDEEKLHEQTSRDEILGREV